MSQQKLEKHQINSLTTEIPVLPRGALNMQGKSFCKTSFQVGRNLKREQKQGRNGNTHYYGTMAKKIDKTTLHLVHMLRPDTQPSPFRSRPTGSETGRPALKRVGPIHDC